MQTFSDSLLRFPENGLSITSVSSTGFYSLPFSQLQIFVFCPNLRGYSFDQTKKRSSDFDCSSSWLFSFLPTLLGVLITKTDNLLLKFTGWFLNFAERVLELMSRLVLTCRENKTESLPYLKSLPCQNNCIHLYFLCQIVFQYESR